MVAVSCQLSVASCQERRATALASTIENNTERRRNHAAPGNWQLTMATRIRDLLQVSVASCRERRAAALASTIENNTERRRNHAAPGNWQLATGN
jgi:hypothetical protein